VLGQRGNKLVMTMKGGTKPSGLCTLAAQEPGTSVKLVLETFIDHDELVPELISDTLKEDFDLTLYTDVNL